MSRRPREEGPGTIHHVFARGNRQQAIYLDDADRAAYLDLLGRTVRWQRWRCLAYCLMSNHAHLVIETPLPNLGQGMQRVHSVYARSFNKRHRLSGHHFQGRFGSGRIGDDTHLWTVLRYVARNPVEAGLCERADQWRWSSYGAVLRDAAPAWLDSARLLGLLSAFGGEPRRQYADLAQT